MACTYCEGMPKVTCHVCMDDVQKTCNFADGVSAVYVTTEGDFSEFCIDLIFTNREAALARLDQLTLVGNPCGIQIRPLDIKQTLIARRYWMSWIWLSDGLVERHYEKQEQFGWAEPSTRGEKMDVQYINHITRTGCEPPKKVWAMSYESQEHADKLAAEFRQDLLRKCAELGIIIPGSRRG